MGYFWLSWHSGKWLCYLSLAEVNSFTVDNFNHLTNPTFRENEERHLPAENAKCSDARQDWHWVALDREMNCLSYSPKQSVPTYNLKGPHQVQGALPGNRHAETATFNLVWLIADHKELTQSNCLLEDTRFPSADSERWNKLALKNSKKWWAYWFL